MTKKQRAATVVRLAQLDKRDKCLTPEAVVQDARNPKSPLRAGFPDEFWDDSWAAHQHRLELARGLIQTFRVEVTNVDRGYAAPLYVHDPDLPPKVQGYKNIASFAKDEEAGERLLEQEFARVVSLLERCAAVADNLGLRKRFLAMLRKVEVVRSALENG